jgi:hypothetical protein
MHAFLESYLYFLREKSSEFLHRKLLFGAGIALETALWTVLIGIAFAALYEFCWFACRRFDRLLAEGWRSDVDARSAPPWFQRIAPTRCEVAYVNMHKDTGSE